MDKWTTWSPLLIPVLGYIAVRVRNYFVAKKEAEAALLEKQAAVLKADTDPTNDAEASKLEREAIEARAEAAAAGSVKP